jgi:aldehyde:ferredoxin oxidoreductase
VPLGLDRLSELLNLATGFNHNEESLVAIGTDLTHLARKYNLRNGRTAEDDTLPDRFFDEESLAGFMKGKKLERAYFKSIVQDYYKQRGWSKEGVPA